MKTYKIGVGACGPTILYTTIKAENAEEAARKYLPEGVDEATFAREVEAMRMRELPDRTVREENEPFKDALGKALSIGDCVAVISSEKKLPIRKARIEKTTKSTMTCKTAEEKSFRYVADFYDGVTIQKAVKINWPIVPAVEEGAAVDALGQKIRIDDLVVYRDEVDMNYCPGYLVGKVSKISPKMVTIKALEHEYEVKRRHDLVVVIKAPQDK